MQVRVNIGQLCHALIFLNCSLSNLLHGKYLLLNSLSRRFVLLRNQKVHYLKDSSLSEIWRQSAWRYIPDGVNRQSTKKHNTYQLLYIYSIPPDVGLQICPKHVEVDWRNKLRINSASSWFSLHRGILSYWKRTYKFCRNHSFCLRNYEHGDCAKL
jgi:hypothetical protein